MWGLRRWAVTGSRSRVYSQGRTLRASYIAYSTKQFERPYSEKAAYPRVRLTAKL